MKSLEQSAKLRQALELKASPPRLSRVNPPTEAEIVHSEKSSFFNALMEAFPELGNGQNFNKRCDILLGISPKGELSEFCFEGDSFLNVTIWIDRGDIGTAINLTNITHPTRYTNPELYKHHMQIIKDVIQSLRPQRIWLENKEWT